MAVNGKTTKDVTLRVSLEADHIALDGHLTAPAREPIVLALHKPVGYVTTRSDPQGRKTVYDLLPKLDRFVFPVGRLDLETSGLLIVTDDHRLGERLTNPESHVPKTYEAIVDVVPDPAQLQILRAGVAIGRGETSRPARVEMGSGDDGRPRLTLVIEEGRNRQVRRMLAAVGLSVLGLRRVAIGALELGSLASGAHARLSRKDVTLLQEDRR